MKTAAERYDAVTEEYRRRWGGEYAGRSKEYREMMMAAIEGAIAEERARCVLCIRQQALEGGSQWALPLQSLAIELIEAIERGDKP